jgi:F0F1-type ATP synthase assembly protein I
VAISISLVLALAAAVYLLQKYGGLRVWHAIVCILLGFYLATSSLAPQIRSTVTAIVRALTGHG